MPASKWKVFLSLDPPTHLITATSKVTWITPFPPPTFLSIPAYLKKKKNWEKIKAKRLRTLSARVLDYHAKDLGSTPAPQKKLLLLLLLLYILMSQTNEGSHLLEHFQVFHLHICCSTHWRWLWALSSLRRPQMLPCLHKHFWKALWLVFFPL
jgi:hypothetical protein